MTPAADTLTVLRSRGPRLAKLLYADGGCEGYDRAKSFTMHPVPVDGVDSLARLLARLLVRPDCCAIRGEPVDLHDPTPRRRLLHIDHKTGELPTVSEQARQWVALDLDDVARPVDLPASDLVGCARVAMVHLPRTFTGARCVVQATAGHGIKPGIRLRLWFWCSRAVSGAELKRWLQGTPAADPSVFGACQPIYTAAPVFAPGAADPLPARMLVLDGVDAVVPPTAAAMAPPTSTPPPQTEPASSGNGPAYVRTALARAASRITSGGPRHPAIVSEARSLARLVKAGLLTESELHAVLRAAAKQAGKDDDVEVAACIEWGLDHASDGYVPAGVAHG